MQIKHHNRTFWRNELNVTVTLDRLGLHTDLQQEYQTCPLWTLECPTLTPRITLIIDSWEN